MNEEIARKEVPEEVQRLYFDGATIGESLKVLENCNEKYGENAVISEVQHAYRDGHHYAVFVNRPETDQEYNARVNKERYWEIQRQNAERLQYEALKKKFEGGA